MERPGPASAAEAEPGMVDCGGGIDDAGDDAMHMNMNDALMPDEAPDEEFVCLPPGEGDLDPEQFVLPAMTVRNG